MQMKKTILFLSIATLLMMLCSCRTPYYRMYSEAPLSKDKVAFLLINATKCKCDVVDLCWVTIESVDGEKTSSTWDNPGNQIIEILPGKHTIVATFHGGTSTKRLLGYPVVADVDVEAGYTYSLYGDILGDCSGSNNKWRPEFSKRIDLKQGNLWFYVYKLKAVNKREQEN